MISLAALRQRFAAEPQLLLPLCAANSIAYLPLLTMPWLVGVLSQHRGRSPEQAGALVTLELALLAAAAILLGSQIHRVPRRTLALIGAAAFLSSSLALALELPGSALIVVLGIAGVGCGVCSAAGTSLVSQAADPGRVTANLWIWTVIWQSVVWFVTPLVVARWGSAGLAGVLGVAALVLMPWLARMPPTARGVAQTQIRHSPARISPLVVAPVVLCVAGFWLRDSVTWSLAERRGTLLGVTDFELARTLTAASILGVVGPLAANLLGSRLGRAATLLFGLCAVALVMQVIAMAESPLLYQAGFLLWTSSSLFAWTYLMELTATADSAGRVAAISSGVMFAAAACGPLLGGLVTSAGGPTTLRTLIAVLSAITIGTALFALQHRSKSSAPASSNPKVA
jgi:MFS family permease